MCQNAAAAASSGLFVPQAEYSNALLSAVRVFVDAHTQISHSKGASPSETLQALLVLVPVQEPSSPVHNISFSMWLAFPSHLVSYKTKM